MVIDTDGGPQSLTDAESYAWPDTTKCNGLCFTRSEGSSAHVRDGMSNTYLVGEKYLDPQQYTTGTAEGDNATAYSGAENDLVRWTANVATGGAVQLLRPRQDTSGDPLPDRFGSPHSSGWHASFCDGSGRALRFELDPEIHRRLGVRDDGESIDQSMIR